MKTWQMALFLVGVALVASTAKAQTGARVRGTITAIESNTLSVRSRDGRDLKVQLADNLSVSVAKAARFEDIKPGDYVGSATRPGPDGVPIALEVHYLAPTVPEGNIAWDLQPGSSMINANVGALVQSAGKRELTLQYKGATQRIVVPDDAPIVRAVPGTRADLVPGEYVFIGAQVGADGTLSAARIQVSKDGVKPPQ